MNRNSIFTLSIIFIMIFTVFSCRKNSKYYKSYGEFIVNDQLTWRSDRVLPLKNNDSVMTFSFCKGIYFYSGVKPKKYPKEKDIYSYKEVLSFMNVPKLIGKQFFSKMSGKILKTYAKDSTLFFADFVTGKDGGPTEEQFFVDSNHLDQCWIEITKEENNFKKIWGNFKLVMIKDPEFNNVYIYPENITIKSGEFYVEF
ncbi:MAG TPA: hypothetical protein PKX92_04585 [Edaphocola sp.]|nr:hypothetical protein [Edaphocola sp.]